MGFSLLALSVKVVGSLPGVDETSIYTMRVRNQWIHLCEPELV